MTTSSSRHPHDTASPARVSSSPQGPVDRDTRWRLILGPNSNDSLPLNAALHAADKVLEQLYSAEHADRGLRTGDGPLTQGFEGDVPLAPVITWLGEARDLFPTATCERIVGHALNHFGLTGLVSAPDVLASFKPSLQLATTLLTLASERTPDVEPLVRRIIAVVVSELRDRFENSIRTAISATRRSSKQSIAQRTPHFDFHATIRASLGNVNPATGRMSVIEPKFRRADVAAQRWEVVIVVDQSASMSESVIHAAVTASIFASLPSFRTKLILFSGEIVDVSHCLDDPVELLLRVQLGGGTDIGSALGYARGLVDDGSKTLLVLITDFDEMGSLHRLRQQVTLLREDRVKMLGLAALSSDGSPDYNRAIAQELADLGMDIAALTPSELTDWVLQAIAS